MVNLRSLAVTATALCSSALAAPFMADGSQPAATSDPSVAGKYIVMLKSGLQTRDLDAHVEWVNGVHKRSLGARQFKGIEHTYDGQYDFKGYAGQFDDETLAAIKNSPEVSVARAWRPSEC